MKIKARKDEEEQEKTNQLRPGNNNSKATTSADWQQEVSSQVPLPLAPILRTTLRSPPAGLDNMPRQRVNGMPSPCHLAVCKFDDSFNKNKSRHGNKA